MGRLPERIYLDYNATTPLAPEVLAAMTDTLAQASGNPSSTHAEGAEARRRIEVARRQIAEALNTVGAEIVFTAGATEANNMAFHAVVGAVTSPGHLVTTAIEHPSVIEPSASLEAEGWRVTRVAVDEEGLLESGALAAVLEPDTRLVSVILANNETGVVQDMEAVCAALEGSDALLHVDATQAVGKWPVDFVRLGADYLSLSAHKLGGPKGTGCLIARPGAPLAALLQGGPQEKRLRGGTENVAGIVGLGVACEITHRDLDGRMKRFAELRDRLWAHLRGGYRSARRNAPAEHSLPNTLNVELPGIEGDVLLQALDVEGVAASAGAACHSGSVSPSHVLVAMGRSPEQARASLRFSVGDGTAEGEIDRAAELVLELVARMRGEAGRG